MAQTKKPTGLTITRNGNNYIFAWKIASENHGAGQKLDYRLKVSGKWYEWTNVSVTSSATSKSVTISKNDFYPVTIGNADKLQAVEFRIKGQRSPYTKDGKTITPTYSDYATKTMDINKPRKPVVVSAIGTSWNISSFAWSINANDTDSHLYTSYEWQTIMVTNSTVTDGSKLKWTSNNPYWQTSTGTSTSNTKTITETSSVVSTGSHTRWFRVRSRGCGGASDWAYAKLVYARPNKPVIGDCNVTEKSSNYLVSVKWETSSSPAKPIDEVELQYCVGTPTAGMQLPASPSWTIATTASDSKGTDQAVFYTAGKLQADECLWVKVIASHDDRGTESDAKLIKKGKLADPTLTSATVSNGVASVTATNNSSACIYTGNVSSTKRLFMLVQYKDNKKYKKPINVGVITTSDTVPVSINVPNYAGVTAYKIGVRALVGVYSYTTMSDGTRRYAYEAEMKSAVKWSSGNLPSEPTNLTASFSNKRVKVTWDWTWADADEIELSWSTDLGSWMSTEEPETYTISQQVSEWYIEGLEIGKTYYIKARLHDSENDIWSDYSEEVEIVTTSAPLQPTLKTSSGAIALNGNVTLSWTYEPTDDSEQAYAEIVYNNNVIAHTDTAKQYTLGYSDFAFGTSGSYDFKVRVKSASGSYSDYSDTVTVEVQDPPTAVISQTSLTTVSGVSTLTEMPMTMTVTGAGNGGITTISIERAEDYYIERPDEAEIGGYRGETVYLISFIGEAQQTAEIGDLRAYLDDGAKYTLIATVKDGVGQTDTATLDFIVDWSHQAIKPEGTVVIDGTIAKITPTAPTGTATGDYCDIYRLSKDKPELVIPNASFGTTYVDPYPAINGGYRLVFRTKNGDYITSANAFAWLDIESGFDYEKAIIEFAKDKVELYYNVDTNHNWSKDFIETKYLGGSVQGDWNPAVSRSATINSVTLNLSDEDTIEALRRLAVYSGICNVRTLDGSSFHANVDVTETNSHERYGLISEFSLSITRVDGQTYDGVALSAWS